MMRPRLCAPQLSTRFENMGTTKSGYEVSLGVDLGWTGVGVFGNIILRSAVQSIILAHQTVFTSPLI